MSKNRIQATIDKGLRQQRAGRLDRAAKSYRKVLSVEPNQPEALHLMGVIAHRVGNFDDAVELISESLRVNPNNAPAIKNLAGVLQDQQRLPEALEHYQAAIEAAPEDACMHSHLGNVLKELGRVEEAIGCHCRALELNPRSHVALHNLGSLLMDLGRCTEAVGCFSKAVELQPDVHLAHRHLGAALGELGRAREAVSCFRRALELRPDDHHALSNLLCALSDLPDTDRTALFAEHRRFDACHGEPLRSQYAAHTNRPEPTRPLRVGFVSGDFRDHPAAHFIEPFFAQCATAEFEIFCYANQTIHDDVSARLRGKVEHWRNVAGLSDDELADAIRHDAIDILVDLSGHTARNRLLVFARKPAPIQVSMIGGMQTTGLSAMDYRITDDDLDPAGSSETFSVEKLVRLPAGAATFRPPAECPPVNELPALSNGFVTFGSFNNPATVTPEALAAWVEILRAMPTARLIVAGRAGAAVQRTLVEQGIAAERIEVVTRLLRKEFLALHHRVDLLLDTFPCPGAAATLLAAWMGVPFVTVAGEGTTGQAGANVLRPIGLEVLIASGAADYVQRAVVAASDLPRLAQWRTHLRGKLVPLLGDGDAYTRQLERAFREMWWKWCGTREPL